MEPGRLNPSVNGVQNTDLQDQQPNPVQDSTTVHNKKGQTVTAVLPDQVSPKIPRPKHTVQRPPLKTRTITKKAAAPGIINRAISRIRNRPTNSQRAELHLIYNHLKAQMPDSQSATHMHSTRNHFIVNRDSNGYQICAAMVATGLARFEGNPQSDDPVRIRFVCPNNFTLQTKALEALIPCYELSFTSDGQIDWRAVAKRDQQTTPAMLADSKLLDKDSLQPEPQWYLNPDAVNQLHLKTGLIQRLDALPLQKNEETVWDFTRKRMRQLGAIARDAGMEPINTLLKDHTKRLSLLKNHQWQQLVEEVRDSFPRLADELERVTPPFAEVLQPDAPDKPLYGEPNYGLLRKGLTELQLLNTPVTLAQIEALEVTGDFNLGYPLLDGFRTSVIDKRKAEMAQNFKALSLPKTKPINRKRMQAGLGQLIEHYPDIYKQCIDDKLRAEAIAKATARVEGETQDKKDTFSSNDRFKNQVHGSLTSAEMAVADNPGDKSEGRSVTMSTEYMSPKRVLATLKAYDQIDTLLKSTNSKTSTLGELSQVTIEQAFAKGESLSMKDWRIGMGKTPKRPWIKPAPTEKPKPVEKTDSSEPDALPVSEVQDLKEAAVIKRTAPPGFPNFGNTCFINGSLKALLAAVPTESLEKLREQTFSNDHHDNIRKHFVDLADMYQGKTDQPVNVPLKNLLQSCWKLGQTNQDGANVFKTLFPSDPARGIRQQDASEFLGALMDILQLNKQPETSFELTGWVRGDFTEHGLGYLNRPGSDTMATDHSSLVQVPLGVDKTGDKPDLQQCVSSYQKPEDRGALYWNMADAKSAGYQPGTSTVLDRQFYSGFEKFDSSGVSQLEVDVKSLKTLGLQLGVFDYTNQGGQLRSQKQAGRVRDIMRHSQQQQLHLTVTDAKSRVPHALTLEPVSICYHHGNSPDSGHYTAVTWEQGNIFHHDDKKVKALKNMSQVKGEPYLMFYRVVGTPQPLPQAIPRNPEG